MCSFQYARTSSIVATVKLYYCDPWWAGSFLRVLCALCGDHVAVIRDIDRLTASTFDVLVVGGGIYGLAIAYDAAQRGLAVALIERNDFGSGSSFNHLRTIPGGLRALRTCGVRGAGEWVGERATLARIAPHALKPLSFA